jgi:hypothetical protein
MSQLERPLRYRCIQLSVATLLLKPKTKPNAKQAVCLRCTYSSEVTIDGARFKWLPSFTHLRNINFLFHTLAAFFGYLGFSGPLFFIASRALAAHASPVIVQYSLPILNAASFFGRQVPCFLLT